MIGNGKLVNLRQDKDDNSVTTFNSQSPNVNQEFDMNSASSFFESTANETKMIDGEDKISKVQDMPHPETKNTMSWASLVNPSASSLNDTPRLSNIVEDDITTSFVSMNLEGTKQEVKDDDSNSGSQFSDADDDESIEIPLASDDESSSNDDEYASIGDDFSDEECDVYILDPEELEEKIRLRQLSNATKGESTGLDEVDSNEKQNVLQELDKEFPSLTAASYVPYEGSDDEFDGKTKSISSDMNQSQKLEKKAEEEKMRREASLKPLSKSGKLFNSFGKDKKYLSKHGVNLTEKRLNKNNTEESYLFDNEEKQNPIDPEQKPKRSTQSRVIGSAAMSGQSTEVDDDGEGWVTSTKEIMAMKATGTLDPFNSDHNSQPSMRKQENLPSKCCRTACATTDFAMQNVILQMNLELLTVDGVRVRKLKSWVQRCSTCTEVYTSIDSTRLFCGKCGSSSIQRVAASVDGKSGRLKLHLKKNYQHRLRGTQYSLPKPGKQNRFMGDLLLSEDQLMYGAWAQRVKQSKSKNAKAAQSIFGADIASTVGCNADLTKLADIQVGLGRKNPNSTKFGRERRGKKKKSNDKACGLRRY